jgi:hypothetical protein
MAVSASQHAAPHLQLSCDPFCTPGAQVLSVVAQQLLAVQNALRSGVERFLFDGRDIRLVPSCGVFVTMNPGYAGRSELPDNLQALFRPVRLAAMLTCQDTPVVGSAKRQLLMSEPHNSCLDLCLLLLERLAPGLSIGRPEQASVIKSGTLQVGELHAYPVRTFTCSDGRGARNAGRHDGPGRRLCC